MESVQLPEISTILMYTSCSYTISKNVPSHATLQKSIEQRLIKFYLHLSFLFHKKDYLLFKKKLASF